MVASHHNRDGKPKIVYRTPKEAIAACIRISKRSGRPQNFYPCKEGNIGRHYHITTRVKRRR